MFFLALGQQFHRVFDDVIIECLHILESFEVMCNLMRDSVPKVPKSSLLTG